MKHRFQVTWIFTIVFGLFLVFIVPVYASVSVFNWGVNSWANPPVTLVQAYPGIGSPATDFNFTFSGDTGEFLPVVSPQTNTTVTGGTSGPTLFIGANYTSLTQAITLTIDLTTTHAISVSFTLMDIDWGSEGNLVLYDEVVVTGSGTSIGAVTPILTATNPSVVTVAGNVATAAGTAVENHMPDGNVFVDFGSQPINQIVIVYRPGPGSSSNPDGGGIGLYNISFTPAMPTAVSLQSFQAQSAGVVPPILLSAALLAGVTVAWVGQRRRRVKSLTKPIAIDTE